MLRMLDLLLKTTKLCLVLTIIRLLTSAFGYEFGISRQYLRLLEWILQLGKERIERCESEHRMQQELIETSLEGQMDITSEACSESSRQSQSKGVLAANPPTRLDLDKGENVNSCAGHSDGMSENKPSTKRERRVGVTLAAEFIERAKWGEHKQTNKSTSQRSEAEQLKRRRVSTPDGPPIFLFDDEDEDDEDDGEHQDELRDGNSLNDSFKPMSVNHEARKHEFHLEDAARLVVKGISAIIDDEVTKRFTHEELKTWNLLTRTNAKNYQFMSRSLGFWWFTGLIIRYAILMPLRIMFTLTGFIWLISTMPLVGFMPKILRDKPYRLVSLMAFRMLSCGINSRLKFHNRQYRAHGGSICVANHTSPLDVVLLASDNCYTLVGQRHGGLLGVLQFTLSKAANHIWFERGEMRDRQLVAARLKEHVNVSSNLPVLIFPEGTCINNSAVMMFRKGSFEVTDRIYPVAIKYDPRFGDPFWNSSKQSYVQYLLMIMSTWAIKCDVWYLQPMDRLAGEGSAEFANRVKAEIAKQAGLEDLAWDGQLKRSSVKPTWLFQQQEDYVRRLKLE